MYEIEKALPVLSAIIKNKAPWQKSIVISCKTANAKWQTYLIVDTIIY